MRGGGYSQFVGRYCHTTRMWLIGISHGLEGHGKPMLRSVAQVERQLCGLKTICLRFKDVASRPQSLKRKLTGIVRRGLLQDSSTGIAKDCNRIGDSRVGGSGENRAGYGDYG